MAHLIRDATESDLAAIAEIYAHEVVHEVSTFDLVPPGLDYWLGRLESTDTGNHLVVALNPAGLVDGFAYSAAYRPRAAYAQTRETSIYLAKAARGQGLGRQLYDVLLGRLENDGIHTVLALIALPNPGSEALHLGCGYSRVGTLTEVGYKFDRWVDTAWFEKRLVLSAQ